MSTDIFYTKIPKSNLCKRYRAGGPGGPGMMKITQISAFVCKKLHAQHAIHSCGVPPARRRGDFCSSPPMGLWSHGNRDRSVRPVVVLLGLVRTFGFEHGFDRGQ